MFNTILNGFSKLGTVYLWTFPLGGLKRDIYPIFKSVSNPEDLDKKFNDRVLKIFDEF